jgi:signal transduction histidine kinase
MECPVVFLLIVVSFQTAVAYRTFAFRYIAIGWIANLLSLFASLIFLPTISIAANVASISIFWYAINKYGGDAKPPYLRKLTVYWVVLLVIYWLCSIIRGTYPLNSHLFLITAILIVSFSVLALVSLAVYFKNLGKGLHQYQSEQWRLVYFATLLYALIQPTDLITFTVISATFFHVIISVSLISKLLVLFGIVRLFIASAERTTRSQVEQESSKQQLHMIDELAHELGTPIGEILSRVDALAKSIESREISRQLERIGSAASRVAAIVHASSLSTTHESGGGLDEFGDPLARRVLLECQVVNVNTLVEIAQNAVRKTRSENVVYSREYTRSCCVECVPIEIVQVLTNLLRNSYDAFVGAHGQINIKTVIDQKSATSGSAGCLKVIIRDDGEGIPIAHMARIFIEGYSTRLGVHRGLGLAIAKRLVEKNHGMIEINSPPSYISAAISRGTEVVLTFRRVPCFKMQLTT